MKNKLAVLVLSIALTVAFSACGGKSTTADGGNVAIENNGVQEVTTTFTSRDYAPIIVAKDVPVKWTINISDKDLNGCNNAMVIPSLGIEKELTAGENTIEFTPTASGDLLYSCWMGMIRSTISVVDANAAAEAPQTDAPTPTAGNGDVAAIVAADEYGLVNDNPGGCCMAEGFDENFDQGE